MPVCVGGDGDFLMGVTAIWTAVHYRIPLLYVVANNQSFFNDEVHQERVARMRGRPVENKWIGMRMDDPEIDVAGIALAQAPPASDRCARRTRWRTCWPRRSSMWRPAASPSSTCGSSRATPRPWSPR